jgi:hypothetical protein
MNSPSRIGLPPRQRIATHEQGQHAMSGPPTDKVTFNLVVERDDGADIETIEVVGAEGFRGLLKFVEDQAAEKGWIEPEAT